MILPFIDNLSISFGFGVDAFAQDYKKETP